VAAHDAVAAQEPQGEQVLPDTGGADEPTPGDEAK
jgi:hypothetical protein